MANTIILENLIFSGIHGLRQKEKLNPQRFKFNIEVTPKRNSLPTKDDMSETVDYSQIKKITQKITEESSFNLIETLAGRIADAILEDKEVIKVKISISKIDIWENGAPGAELTRHAPIHQDKFLDFDIRDLVRGLVEAGAVSIPILPESRRLTLLKEAESLPYNEQPKVVGKNKVREEIFSFDKFSEESPFLSLAEDFSEFVNWKLQLENINPFNSPLCFNELALQLYKNGSSGITPHVDGLSRINLVCVFILKGQADFALCSDRSGSNPVYLDTTPGNVIIMRGPGFLGSSKRPMHFVTNINEERLVFGLRQKKLV